MSPHSSPSTQVLVSFSSAYGSAARRIRKDLNAANIAVRYDQWEGGGGLPAVPSVANTLDDIAVVLPLITPSSIAGTWLGDEWKRAIFDPAIERGIRVLPVRAEGDQVLAPEFMQADSFADLRDRDYAEELQRLIRSIRDISGDDHILVADKLNVAAAVPLVDVHSPTTLEIEFGEALGVLQVRHGVPDRFGDELLPMMYDGLFYELGVEFPIPIRSPNPALAPNSARLLINGVPEAELAIPAGSVMVNENADTLTRLGIRSTPAINPANGNNCAWIPIEHRASVMEMGLVTWDDAEFLVLAISALLRNKAADFIGILESRAILERIATTFPVLVAESVPRVVSEFAFTDVLRRLLAEHVSVRNLRRILMTLADWGRVEDGPLMLTEYVRAALRRQLSYQFSRGSNQLAVLLLDPSIEAKIGSALRYTPTGGYLDLTPDGVRTILEAIRQPMVRLPNGVQIPPILTVMEIRSAVRRLVATEFPQLHVLSYQDLRPDIDIQPVGRIELDGFCPRAGCFVGDVQLWRDAGGAELNS